MRLDEAVETAARSYARACMREWAVRHHAEGELDESELVEINDSCGTLMEGVLETVRGDPRREGDMKIPLPATFDKACAEFGEDTVRAVLGILTTAAFPDIIKGPKPPRRPLVRIRSNFPPDWAEHVLILWEEDECTRSDPDAEHLSKAWLRFTGKPVPETDPIAKADLVDTFYTLWPGGWVEINSYCGDAVGVVVGER